MNVELRIERLILEGLPLEPNQGPVVKAAVEAELARLLTQRGVSPELQQRGALANANGDNLQLVQTNSPSRIGAGIAGAVYREIR